MGKLKVVELKIGESIIGELLDTSADVVKLKERDGETVSRVTVTTEVVETIDEEVETDDVIEIKRVGKSSFEIYTHDEWPEEKKA